MLKRRTLVLWLLAMPLLLVSAVIGLAVWLLHQPSGSEWLLSKVPGLTVEAPQGSLLGDFAARRAVYTMPGGMGEVRLTGLRWQGLSLTRHSLYIRALAADEVEVVLAPSKGTVSAAPKPPASLALPLTVQIDALSVGHFVEDALQLNDLRAALTLGEQEHHVRLERLRWEQLGLSGDARIGTRGALPVKLSLALQTGQARGQLQAQGPLATLDVKAKLEQAGQDLQIQSTVTPFAVWPIQALQADARNLDLHALMTALPRTALTGQATLQSSGWHALATVQMQLSNSAAGRWDQQQLPVQSLHLALQARPDQPEDLRLQALDARLLGGGSLSGQGSLAPDAKWRLQLRLQSLRPETLDRRAAAMLLSGTAELAGAPGAPLEVKAQLTGNKLKLDLQGSVQSDHIVVSHALLAADAAQAELQGHADRRGKLWAIKAAGQVQNFDPQRFWKTAPQALVNAKLDADVQIALEGHTWPQGQLQAQLQPSRWAALPLEGQARYASGDVQADLSLAGGKAKFNAHLDGTPQAPRVRGDVYLSDPNLALLNPVLRDRKLAGSGQADFKFTLDPGFVFGLEGQAALQELQLSGALQVRAEQARVQLQASNAWDAPLHINAELHQAAWAGQNVEQAKLAMSGSWAQHQLQVDMNGRFHPPSQQPSQPWAGQAHLALSGALSAQSWQAHISRLQARADDPKLPAVIDATDLQLALAFNPDHAVTDAQLAPGALELGGARWRWSELQWHAPRSQGALPEVHAVLDLEPLSVAPLLARWQPEFGWSGDLVVGGSLRINSTNKLELDALLERKSGDMSVQDDTGRRQALGLDTLRLALSAHDGHWIFKPELAGSRWGSLTGQLSAQAPPGALVPGPKAELSGDLHAQTDHVGSWGALLPPGWRLGGTLGAQFKLSGTVGAPHLLGAASGKELTVRNLLLGVDFSQGAFQLDFDGTSATLKNLSLHGGSGSIEASGTALLGERPQAKLDFKADHFTVFNRIDRRLIASGQAQLQLDAQALKLDGKLNVDEGQFDFSHGDAPSLGEDVYVLRAEQTWQPPATEETSARKTMVNITVDLGKSLRLRGHGFESLLRGSLTVTQTSGKPSVKGSVSTVGGTFAAYGQKLDIERGEVIFNGPYDNPRLDILALRANSDTRVGVIVSGSAQSPVIKLYSDPDMSDTDKLAWLLLGHGSEGLGQADTAVLQQAALALLAGDGQSTSDKMIKSLGLDEVSVRQGEATTDSTTRETIVHLGKQISKRWYVGYERSLNATTGSWQLIYRIAQRFTLRAQTGDDNALEVIWQWKWD